MSFGITLNSNTSTSCFIQSLHQYLLRACCVHPLGMQKQANSYTALPSWGWRPVGEIHIHQTTLNSLQRREQPTGEERGLKRHLGSISLAQGWAISRKAPCNGRWAGSPAGAECSLSQLQVPLHLSSFYSPHPPPRPHRREGNRGHWGPEKEGNCPKPPGQARARLKLDSGLTPRPNDIFKNHTETEAENTCGWCLLYR